MSSRWCTACARSETRGSASKTTPSTTRPLGLGVDEPRGYRVVKGFRVLAIVAAVAVYGQIVLGGVVRITGSGLGCPDWPACQGKIVPDFANSHVVIEYAHRLVGTTAGLLMLATAA